MSARRKAVAVACIALVVLAAVVPLGGVSFDWLIVTPAFVVLPPPAPVPLPPASDDNHEQPIALLAVVDSRGPPAFPLL